MFRIPVDGPANVYCDNQSVVYNATIPESTLVKKRNAICYHRVCEAEAAGIIQVAKEDSKTNLADGLTKPLPRDMRGRLSGRILYGLYSDKEVECPVIHQVMYMIQKGTQAAMSVGFRSLVKPGRF
jgi:hypothetical protein